MPRPSYTRGQLSSCSPIPATSLGSLAHLAVGMATGKTQTSLRARLNGSKPRPWFRPPGGRRGRNAYHGMPAVGSKHASLVDYCSRSKTLQAPMFVSVRSIEKRGCRFQTSTCPYRNPKRLTATAKQLILAPDLGTRAQQLGEKQCPPPVQHVADRGCSSVIFADEGALIRGLWEANPRIPRNARRGQPFPVPSSSLTHGATKPPCSCAPSI